MKEAYIIRHTTPDIEPGLCYGSTDIGVKESFIQEADEIKQVLNSFNPELVLSSPLIRCDKLAQHLFSDSRVRYDNRIKELNFGDWELKPWNNIDKSVMERWSNNFVNVHTPNGENFNDLYQRSIKCMNDVLLEDNTSKIALVTHSGVMRCLLSKYLSIPLDKIFRLKINYGAVIKITIHDDFEEVEFVK